jgi:capsular polysaccharide biosynthesis protein
MGKKLAAEMATDLERRQKSQRFTIIEPARIPERPIKPNRRSMLLMGSVMGLGVGLVLAIGNEARRNVLLGDWELPANTPVLGHLPRIVLGKEKHSAGSSKVRKAVWSSSAGLIAIAAWITERWS